MYKTKNKGWKGVAEYVGHGITVKQCQDRWDHYISPTQRTHAGNKWTVEDVSKTYYVID